MMICHNCGAELGEDYSFCSICGTRLNNTRRRDIIGFSCPSCGNELSNSELVCRKCGFVFPDNRNFVSKSFTCARCGSIRIRSSYEERIEYEEIKRAQKGRNGCLSKVFYWLFIGWWWWWIYAAWKCIKLITSLFFLPRHVRRRIRKRRAAAASTNAELMAKKKITYRTTIYSCKNCKYEWKGQTTRYEVT